MALRDVNAVVTITTNAVQAIDDGKKLKKIYADINEQLNLMKSKGKVDTKEFKQMQKLADDTKAKINEMLRGMELIDKVMGDISGHIGKDLNRALRETSKEFNKTSSATDEGKAKLERLRQVVSDLKRELSDRRGLTMSLKDAETQLKNLNNTSLDKLKQGLAAVREEAAKATNPAKQAQYQQYAKNYEAQIAIKEHGAIGSAPATGSLKSEDRLRVEGDRQRLVQAYQAVSQSSDAAHQTWANQALKEIQQYNSALSALTETERKDAKAKSEQTAEAQKQKAARDTMVKLYNGEKASLQELTQAQKQFQSEIDRMKGFNMSQADEQLLQNLEHHLERINQMLKEVSQADIDKVFADIDNQSLETLEATLKKVKENAASLKVGDTAGIDKAAQQMDVLEKKIAEVKARMTEYTSLAERGMSAHKTLANIENASYEDLENTLKFLEERHKKLQGTETKRQQQSIANQDKIKKRMKEMRGELLSEEEIRKRVAQTGKYSATQLQQAYDSLKAKLMNMRSEETEAIRETRKQMKLLQKEIEGVQGRVSGLTKVWTTAVRNIGTYIGVFAGFNYVKGKIEEIVKKNYELSDSLTNVRKVSGLTMSDINQLYTNISKIDTRNTINTLTNLAYQGGKLGIQEYGGVEALTGFVKAAEQVQAALGEDLGEEALPALAKLTENMGLIKSMGVEQAMQKTASAIFALSTSSVSTGQGIVDFSKRLMPVAKSAGVATSELLGLASATESSGLAAEVASTAFVKMFPSIYKNADALETYLGISKGVIREMYDQNRAMDAMVLIFDKMQDMGNLNKYPEIFKLLGSEGARMNTVMSAMANNVDMLRTHLNTSNKAFEEGTAVINEYTLQSNSAAGILERANNIWEKAFVNPEGVDMVKELAEEWYLLSRHVATSDTWMTTFRITLGAIEKIIATLIFLLPTLVRLMLFVGVANTIKYIATNFWDMRKAILAAAGAQGKLNAAMRNNMFGIVAGLALTLVSCFWDLYKIVQKNADATKKLTQEEQDLADAEKMVGDHTRKEVGHLNALYKAATDTLQPMEKRLQWVKQLKQEFPDYFKDLSNEAILAGKAADKYEALAQSLIKAAKARAYQEKMDKISEESVKLQEEIDAGLDYLNQNEKKYKEEKKKQQQRDDITTYGGAVFAGEAAKQGITGKLDAFVDKYEDTEDRVLKKQAQIAQNDQRIQKLAEKVMENTPTPKATEFEPGGGGDEGGGGSTNKVLNAEMRDEQIKAKALIDNIKNYYQRQINALNELANDTNMSEGDLKGRLDRLQEHMNDALANARKAIGGEKNEWEAFKAKMREDLYEQTDEEGYNFSENLLNYIMDNQLDELRDMILKLSETLNKRGDVLLDQILRKATEDEAKNIKQITTQRKLLEKELLEMNYTGKVDRESMSTMENLGLGSLSDNQTKQLQAWKQTGDTEAAKDFFSNREKQWYQMYAQAREHIADIINSPIEKEGDEDRLLRILFGENYKETLKGSEVEGFLNMTLDQWTVFYRKLLDYNDQWTDAQRKFYEDNKKRQDYLFNNNATTIEIKEGVKEMETRSVQRKWTGEAQGTNFSQQAGFSTLSEDPELVRLMLLEEQAQRYYDKMEELRQRDLVSQEMVNEARAALDEAEKNRQQELMTLIDNHISKLEQWTQPVEQFGADMGAAFGKLVFEGESMADGMRSALQSMVQSWGQATIEIIKQIMMQQMKERLLGKATTKEMKKTEKEKTDTVEEGGEERLKATTLLETGAASVVQQVGQMTLSQKQTQDAAESQQEAGKAQGSVLAGIAEGAAKIIGSLGPWGAPLIAVITALLMGLLNTALAALSGGSSSGGNSATTKRKVKLAQGMLTYDSGNVQTVLGDDGRVYHARQSGSLPEGVSMVNEPIVTRVNGQQALVGERGPEIVIGRKATRQMQMNRPDLLRAIALFDRGYTGHQVRTFDEGNLEDMATAIAAASPSATVPESAEGRAAQEARNAAMMQTLGQLAFTIGQLQQQLSDGIQASINMYGENGLHNKMKQADKFLSRYGR